MNTKNTLEQKKKEGEMDRNRKRGNEQRQTNSKGVNTQGQASN